ncbi:MAG: hypothetical protein JWN32_2097, partial [Solirubrobacterales bacterium]|nr:hypothetical protein [Solirubrobacterales bacterium]
MLHRIVVVLVMFVSLGAIPAAASAEACPDEGLREQINSSRLPDCRAYELVTPGADKPGNALALQQSFISNDGNRISFKLYNALQDATVSFGGYVATRGAGGWESHSIGNLPAPDPTSKAGNFNANVNGASSDVSQAFVVTNGGSAANNPVYGAWSVSPDGSASLLAANPPGGSVEQVGSSPDGSHVVLAAYTEPLAPVPGGPLEPGADVLYEHVGGGLRLINVDDSGNLLNPSGARFPSDSKYGGNSGAFNAISSDGSRIFFYSQQPGETPSQPKDQLYMRVNGSHTIEVSAPQPSAPPGSHVHATFAGASADGTKAFFTSSGQLTADATGTGPFLYEFNLPVGAGSGSLRLIAGVDHPVSQVLISDDASHVYYLSADGGGSLFAYHTTGPQAGQTHMVSQGLGDVSLGGDTRLIAELGSNPELIPGEVTPDGNHLLFTSNKQLTAGDTNTGAQLYKFDDSASGGSLTLISTGPAAPTSMFNSELLAANFEAVGQFGDGHYPPDGLLVQD